MALHSEPGLPVCTELNSLPETTTCPVRFCVPGKALHFHEGRQQPHKTETHPEGALQSAGRRPRPDRGGLGALGPALSRTSLPAVRGTCAQTSATRLPGLLGGLCPLSLSPLVPERLCFRLSALVSLSAYGSLSFCPSLSLSPRDSGPRGVTGWEEDDKHWRTLRQRRSGGRGRGDHTLCSLALAPTHGSGTGDGGRFPWRLSAFWTSNVALIPLCKAGGFVSQQ